MATLIQQSKQLPHMLLWIVYVQVEVLCYDEICGKNKVKTILRHLT